MDSSNSPRELVRQMAKGSKTALARLISLAEGKKINTSAILSETGVPAGNPAIVGITGPPGAGKSTLTDKLTGAFRKRKEKIGVIAIDPSSPFSGGALLGDRVRMGNHSGDEGVFIRSLGSRGSLGGLSEATGDIIKLMGAFGAETILIETVGVGQSELDIIRVADTVVVILVPESGDSIQTMKAGIMEIGDIFVVNKADRENAETLSSEIRSTISIREAVYEGGRRWDTPVLLTEAVDGKGVDELSREIKKHGEFLEKSGIAGEKRQKRLRKDFTKGIEVRLRSLVEAKLETKEGGEILSAVLRGTMGTEEGAEKAAALILGRSGKK